MLQALAIIQMAYVFSFCVLVPTRSASFETEQQGNHFELHGTSWTGSKELKGVEYMHQ
jgi:hypothetical protein